MKKLQVIFSVLASFVIATASAHAYVPEPQSEGKYFTGKGTKASETYESSAGMPVYDYANGIQWGPAHLKPVVDYNLHWTDNVFYQDGNERSDTFHSLLAGVLVEVPLSGGQHLLSGGYSTYSEWFNRFDDQDHTDHRGTIGLKLNFVPFTLDLEDTYERTVSRADTEFTDRIERDENAFHSLLEVPFASFFLEHEITDFDIRYSRSVDQVFDHNLFTTYQRVGYDVTPNTQLLGEYAYINVSYPETLSPDDRDGDGHQYMLGMRGNLTERIAYQAWGGVQHRIYDLDPRPDYNGFVARSALQWDPSELNRLTIRADRTPEESTFDGQSFYIRNRVELNWRRQIQERWFLNARGDYAFHRYSRITNVPATGEIDTREDSVWGAGAGVEYLMPNDIISIALNYRFASRDSNLQGFGYDANEVTAGVKASF